jgi:hypothetical protein
MKSKKPKKPAPKPKKKAPKPKNPLLGTQFVYDRLQHINMSVTSAITVFEPKELEKAVEHLFSGSKKEQPTVRIAVGYSVQSPKDQYIKTIGRDKAFSTRTLKWFVVTEARFENDGLRLAKLVLTSVVGGVTRIMINLYADNKRSYRIFGIEQEEAVKAFNRVVKRNETLVKQIQAKHVGRAAKAAPVKSCATTRCDDCTGQCGK